MPKGQRVLCSLSCAQKAQFVGLLTYTFRRILPRQRLFPAFSGFPNDLLSQKGNSIRVNSTTDRSAVFRFCTGFPCSAEQKCVSHVSTRSRICHKISRTAKKPSPFPAKVSDIFFFIQLTNKNSNSTKYIFFPHPENPIISITAGLLTWLHPPEFLLGYLSNGIHSFVHFTVEVTVPDSHRFPFYLLTTRRPLLSL